MAELGVVGCGVGVTLRRGSGWCCWSVLAEDMIIVFPHRIFTFWDYKVFGAFRLWDVLLFGDEVEQRYGVEN